MSTRPVIGVGGENLIDHVTRDGAVTALPGGSPFNVALALGRQTADVRYLTPISTDRWGDLLAETLEASGVTLSGGRVAKPSTIARVTVTNGIPTYDFERDGTAERAVTPQSLAAIMPDDIAALHTGSLALTEGLDGAAWEETCKSAFENGTLVSLDPNVRLSVLPDPDSFRDRIFRMMSATGLLKLSDEDLEGLCPGQTQSAAIESVRAKTSAALVVLTRGPDGASGWIGDTRIDVTAPPVPDLVDTVGAGDTFMATLLAGLARLDALPPERLRRLSRDEVEGLIRRAGLAAAINCGRAGCNPPTLSELEAALSAS
ncbi:carbohydrate kinase family protein [Marivita sp. S2033]|uniref:carbohydrate kinase family protein n=1 Tax=Marivita sp. S2033 TaxID=3373187 RepID=UPI003982BE6F